MKRTSNTGPNSNYYIRREKIIQAAAELFHEKGFNGTSIADIAKKVGLPKGGLYHYIESKKEILYVITSRGIQEVLPHLRVIKNSNLNLQEKIIRAVKTNINYLVPYKEYVSVFLQERNSLLPEHYEQYIRNRDEVEWIFRDIIQEGVNEKVFRDVNVKLVVFAILGMCNWITQWYKPEGDISIKEIAELYADITYKALQN